MAQSLIIQFKLFVLWLIFNKEFIGGVIPKVVSSMVDLVALAGGSV